MVFEFASVADPARSGRGGRGAWYYAAARHDDERVGFAATLEGRVRLLVFDNCEHVVDAVADLIEAILAQSATVKFLSTSREGTRYRR